MYDVLSTVLYELYNQEIVQRPAPFVHKQTYENVDGIRVPPLELVSFYKDYFKNVTVMELNIYDNTTYKCINEWRDYNADDFTIFISQEELDVKDMRKTNKLGALDIVKAPIFNNNVKVYKKVKDNVYIIVINKDKRYKVSDIYDNKVAVRETTLLTAILIPLILNKKLTPEEQTYFKELISFKTAKNTDSFKTAINNVSSIDAIKKLLKTPDYHMRNLFKKEIKDESIKKLIKEDSLALYKQNEMLNEDIKAAYNNIVTYEQKIVNNMNRIISDDEVEKKVKQLKTFLETNNSILHIKYNEAHSYIEFHIRVPISLWKDLTATNYFKAKIKEEHNLKENEALYYITKGIGKLYVLQQIRLKTSLFNNNHEVNDIFNYFTYISNAENGTHGYEKFILFDSIFNPHIDRISCVGSYRTHIAKAIRTNNLINILEMIIMPIRTLNFLDVAIIERLTKYMKQHSDIKCFEYNNKLLTYYDYIKEVKENEKDLDSLFETK